MKLETLIQMEGSLLEGLRKCTKFLEMCSVALWHIPVLFVQISYIGKRMKNFKYSVVENPFTFICNPVYLFKASWQTLQASF